MENEVRDIRLFNTPIEYGLRSLFILSGIAPKAADLQRLIYFDYLVLHTADIDSKQTSLHPSYPYRSAEILIKRERLRNGLLIMKSRQLIRIQFDGGGINYAASPLTKKFLEYQTSDYAKHLKSCASFVTEKFNTYSDSEIDQYMKKNMETWGSEFSREAYLRESMNYE
ncbi:MAG: ABC-three component system middle component 2 [Balneolales bacterium]